MKCHLGKNKVAEVAKEMAVHLGLEKPESFSFHSYRRSSASAAADSGATSDQLVDFFGWANHKMTAEYISTSKKAIVGMADKLIEDQVTKNAFEQNEIQDEKPSYICPESTGNSIVLQHTDKVLIFPNFCGELNL